MLLELYLYLMKIKQRTINMLTELDIMSSYRIINNKHDKLINFKKIL